MLKSVTRLVWNGLSMDCPAGAMLRASTICPQWIFTRMVATTTMKANPQNIPCTHSVIITDICPPMLTNVIARPRSMSMTTAMLGTATSRPGRTKWSGSPQK